MFWPPPGGSNPTESYLVPSARMGDKGERVGKRPAERMSDQNKKKNRNRETEWLWPFPWEYPVWRGWDQISYVCVCVLILYYFHCCCCFFMISYITVYQCFKQDGRWARLFFIFNNAILKVLAEPDEYSNENNILYANRNVFWSYC